MTTPMAINIPSTPANSPIELICLKSPNGSKPFMSNNIEVLDHLGSFIAIPSSLYVTVPVITDEEAHSSIIGDIRL